MAHLQQGESDFIVLAYVTKSEKNNSARYCSTSIDEHYSFDKVEWKLALHLQVTFSLQVDTREQLRTISRINLYKYRFSREYLEHAGLRASDSDGEDTGVLAQEVKEVLPEAVKESVSGLYLHHSHIGVMFP